MRRSAFAVFAVLVVCAGCAKPNARLNAPPHGEAEETSDLQGTFVYMADNAMLADMTMTDTHFLPHRPELTTGGEERIVRMAELMKVYGGTIRLSSDEQDATLLTKRTETLTKYLAALGMDTSSQLVTQDISGGRGMTADEAVLIRRNVGQPKSGKTGDTGKGGKGLGAAFDAAGGGAK